MSEVLRILVCLISVLIPLQVSASVNDSYRLGAGDKIEIVVYGESDLTIEELYINNSGLFDYPYLGRLSAIGKTPEELRVEIYSGLQGDYLIAPKVRVTVVGYRSIYVNGEVKKPGGYQYQPGLTVDKAIALAGGFTDRASRQKIFVTRSNLNDTRSKVGVNYKVLPGDIIEIEQSFF